MIGSTYNPFERKVTIYRRADGSDVAQPAELRAAMTPEALIATFETPAAANLTIETAVAETGNTFTRGGLRLREVGGGNECTTAWGVTRPENNPPGSYVRGYLTAAHCFGLGQNITRVRKYWDNNSYLGVTPTFTQYRSLGGDHDRIFLNDWASTASWWTRTRNNPSAWEDMSSAIWEFWNGAWTCHYGDMSEEWNCSTAFSHDILINVDFVGGSIPMIVTRGQAMRGSTQTCISGDSGGPVWIVAGGAPPNNYSYPAGIMSSRNGSGTICNYVELHQNIGPMTML